MTLGVQAALFLGWFLFGASLGMWIGAFRRADRWRKHARKLYSALWLCQRELLMLHKVQKVLLSAEKDPNDIANLNRIEGRLFELILDVESLPDLDDNGHPDGLPLKEIRKVWKENFPEPEDVSLAGVATDVAGGES